MAGCVLVKGASVEVITVGDRIVRVDNETEFLAELLFGTNPHNRKGTNWHEACSIVKGSYRRWSWTLRMRGVRV